jgi:asparagine synthase (glutamine-hydrolysing)
MCGISGIIAPSLSADSLQLHINHSNNTLAHRGPDAAGTYVNVECGLALGHRRLSIIDLSDAANQPFHSQCGRYVMVFNGEIYNYRDLIEQYHLQHLTTTSDSEVVIELFAQYGINCIQSFNGMFAIAIYDLATQQLWLIRDRLGVKPLLYFWQPALQLFGFASELKAFKHSPLFKPHLSINKQAIAQFLHIGFVPSTASIYSEIKKLPPAHYACYDGQQLKLTPYWSAQQHQSNILPRSEADAKQQLTDLLRSAVAYRLISDVPVGAFLSGGIDSSIVAAFAQEQSSRPLHTFTIGFTQSKSDETQHARAVARHIGSQHSEFILHYDDALTRIEQLLDIYDEPFADSSAIPTLLLSEKVRPHVAVALSGDGGDELFLGYGMYRWAERLNHPLLKIGGATLGRLLQKMPHNRYRRGGMVLDCRNYEHLQSHILSQESYLFAEHELANLLQKPYADTLNKAFIYAHWAAKGNREQQVYAQQQALFDLYCYLPDDLLVKVDRAAMHHALEVRNPLLDYRLVEFALSLEASLKYRKGISKYLLKQVLYDKVPAQIFDRPKQGFSIPLAHWLKTDLRHWLNDNLHPDLVAQAQMVSPQMVAQLKHDFFQNGRDYLYNRLWALALLHQWWKKEYGINP